MTKAKPAKRVTYSDELADRICARIMEGESLNAICKDADMPDRTSVHRWMCDNEAFATKCARAREIQADFLFDQMQEVADTGNLTDVQRAKLRVSTMQWRASKLAPKKYGDKLELSGGTSNVNANVDLATLDPQEAVRMYQDLIGKT